MPEDDPAEAAAAVLAERGGGARVADGRDAPLPHGGLARVAGALPLPPRQRPHRPPGLHSSPREGARGPPRFGGTQVSG